MTKPAPKTVERYCTACGRRLEPTRRVANDYDPYTGEPHYHYIYTCPAWPRLLYWLTGWLYAFHDSVRYRENEDDELEVFLCERW